MTQPKYQLGQKVWIIDGNKVVEREIKAIAVNGYKKIVYSFEEAGDGYDYYERSINIQENKLFPTKEELIKSL